MMGGILNHYHPEKCILGGLYAANLSLHSHLTIPKELTNEAVFQPNIHELPIMSCCKPQIIL